VSDEITNGLMQTNLSPELVEVAQRAALEGYKTMLAAMAYQGKDERYYKVAKIGMSAVGSFSRLYASETNRGMLAVTLERMSGGATERLKAGGEKR
jgi:hypothetical protein